MFTLGRKIDIHYNTNRWILIITALVSILGVFLTGDLLTGIKIGVSVFLTWALTREIDPKREIAAFLAAAISLYSLFVDFKVDLLVVFFILLLLRLINNMTGKRPTLLDLIILFGVSVFLSINMKNSTYLFLFFLSLVYSKENIDSKKLYTPFILLSAFAFIYFGPILKLYKYGSFDFSKPFMIALYIVSVLAYALFIYIDKDKSTLDDKSNKTNPKKIFNAQAFLGFSIVLLFLSADVAIGNMIIYISSIIGVVLYGVFDKLIKS